MMNLGEFAALAGQCIVASPSAERTPGLRCDSCNRWSAVMAMFEVLDAPEGHAYLMIWLPEERN